MLKPQLMKAAFGLIYHTGAAKLLHRYWGGRGVIFCLHHVTPGGGKQFGFAPNSNLEITPEFLDQLIRHVQARGYEVTAISKIAGRLRENNSKKRFAVFTLDDGYVDNLRCALPVFERNNCPFTVYVAPRIADGTCELWWRGLEAVIAKNDRLELSIGDFSFAASTTTLSQKWQAWHKLAPRLQNMDEYQQRNWIKDAAQKYDIDLKLICRNAAMTWDQLRDLAKHKLVTIGAHTLNHYNLLKLPEADATREIATSRALIEQQLQRPIQHFAYPYGNSDAAGPREFMLAQTAGFETAVVTRLGPVETGHVEHLHALPRIMISGRFQDTRYIDALLSGVPSRLSNGFKQLNID